MGILDSDSDSDDASTSSSEVEDKKDVTAFVNKKKASLDDYDAFKGEDEEENETAARMKEILKLREAIGMDRDPAFLAAQAEKEREKERLKNMTQEERMKYDAEKSGDMMAKIRAKQEELKKKKAEQEANQEGGEAEEEEEEVEVKKKKKEKKEKKKKKEKDWIV